MGLSAAGLPTFSLLRLKLQKSEIKQQPREFDSMEDKVVHGVGLPLELLREGKTTKCQLHKTSTRHSVQKHQIAKTSNGIFDPSRS